MRGSIAESVELSARFWDERGYVDIAVAAQGVQEGSQSVDLGEQGRVMFGFGYCGGHCDQVNDLKCNECTTRVILMALTSYTILAWKERWKERWKVEASKLPDINAAVLPEDVHSR